MERRTAVSLIIGALVVGFIAGQYVQPVLKSFRAQFITSSQEYQQQHRYTTVNRVKEIVEMGADEQGWTDPNNVVVAYGACWLDPCGLVRPKSDRPGQVQVMSQFDGYYVLAHKSYVGWFGHASSWNNTHIRAKSLTLKS